MNTSIVIPKDDLIPDDTILQEAIKTFDSPLDLNILYAKTNENVNQCKNLNEITLVLAYHYLVEELQELPVRVTSLTEEGLIIVFYPERTYTDTNPFFDGLVLRVTDSLYTLSVYHYFTDKQERAKKSFGIHRLGYEHETKVFETKKQVKIEIIKCLGVYEFCAVSSYPGIAYIENYMKSGW